jgi:hypothetical protein
VSGNAINSTLPSVFAAAAISSTVVPQLVAFVEVAGDSAALSLLLLEHPARNIVLTAANAIIFREINICRLLSLSKRSITKESKLQSKLKLSNCELLELKMFLI